MKRDHFYQGVVLICLFLLSCTHTQSLTVHSSDSAQPEGEFTRYHFDPLGISIEYPQEWEVLTDPVSGDGQMKRGYQVVFSGKAPLESEQDTFQEALGVVYIPLDEHPGSDGKLPSPRDKNQDLSRLEDFGVTQLAGLEAQWHISKDYPSKNNPSLLLKQMGYSIRRGQSSIKIGWVGEPQKLAFYRPVIEHIARSIEIR